MIRTCSWGATGAVLSLLCSSCGGLVEDSTAAPLAQASAPGRAQQALLLQSSSLWRDPNISVCWEDLRQSTAEHRGWVQAAVEEAFETVSLVDFSGWQQCGAAGAEVVIHVGDDVVAAHAQIGSRAPSALPSMWLNFREQNCSAPGAACRTPHMGYTGRVWSTIQQGAIEVDAVHEFAHVLGFGHEMDRFDTPPGCTPTRLAGFEQMLPFGYWDLTSVSNYCNPALDNDGRLSPLDVAGVQAFYGEQEQALIWLAIGNVRSYGGASVDQVNFAISGRSVRAGLVPTAGDFDGDGMADLFWYDAAGAAMLWWSRGDGRFDSPAAQQIGPGYQPLAGDFNGDGRTDLFMYSPTGNDLIWWGGVFDHSFRSVTRELFGAGLAPVVGDFDGDGCDDLYGYNPSAGSGRLGWSSCDGNFVFVNQRAGAGLRPFAGDFDGDGDDDIYLYQPSGTDVLLKANGVFRTFTELTLSFGVVGNYTPAVGDFDGDGIDDIAWNGVGGASDQLWLMRTPLSAVGTAIVTNLAVQQSSNPLRPAPTGDFNGDGLADILWYDE